MDTPGAFIDYSTRLSLKLIEEESDVSRRVIQKVRLHRITVPDREYYDACCTNNVYEIRICMYIYIENVSRGTKLLVARLHPLNG